MTSFASLSTFISVNSGPNAVLLLPKSPADWNLFIQQAATQTLLPTLASRARILGITADLPPGILHLWEFTEKSNGERNRVILDEAIHVATLLNQIGIRPVALKGLAYLLTGVYSDPAQRYLLDIDLLLVRSEIPRAISHLSHHGYFESESGRFLQFRHHHPAIRRHEGPHIEIHHRVGQGICDRLLPASEILAHATPLAYRGATFLIPSPTCLVNHLILHSQLAHPYRNRIFTPLRAFLDLTLLQERFSEAVNWPGLVKTYSEAGEYSTLALHLKHAHHLLGVLLPEKGLSLQKLSTYNAEACSNPPLKARQLASRCNLASGRLGLWLNFRWHRHLLLARYPSLRFADPIYWIMSFFSRRIRLIPKIVATPSSWPQVFREILRPEFYKNPFAL